MPTAEQIQQAIRNVTDQQSFINSLLRDTLDWPIDLDFEDIEDITYEWSDDELNTVGLSRDTLSGPVLQMQSLEQEHEQPWGIFILDFTNETPFVTGRGLTSPLRKVLRGLVPKRRRQANLPAWDRENLLFICTHQYKHFRFAYFKAPRDGKLAPLTMFGWGPDTPARTACEFNLPFLIWPDNPEDIKTWQSQWIRAFDKEKLTKDFFGIFAGLYHKVVDDIQEVPELRSEARRLAQLLLDRMLFLYFLQRKGWLNEERDYLYSRFLECLQKNADGHNYYSSVLYPLFLSMSNANFVDEVIGAVPFLNGGLFEESASQTQTEQIAQARLRIKNLTFKAIFDELLERFNFTVTEDTPLDVEVAIDPEMLGKIFESLILQLEKEPDKDLRKLTGSYYTPRSIVHFMCRQALKEYLVTQIVGEDTTKVESAKEKIENLLALPVADQLDVNQVKLLMKLFTEAEAKMLRQAILDCRVCDPAVGSGAFPVGMLHEMVAAIARLDLRLYGRDVLNRRNYDYDLKKQVIESCLYGVDVQEQAVRLCELRLWLSLIVDYQVDTTKKFERVISEIPSLPNLSYRIVRGDSLLERLFGHIIQLDVMARDAKTKQLIESIQADKQAYFREADTDEKRRLELKILAKQADLAERLIEAKKSAMTGYQTNIFGDEGMSAKDRKAKENHQQRITELEELKSNVAKAKDELERLMRSKETINRGDIDTLRRQYFHTGEYPTFMWQMDFAEVFGEKGGFNILIENPPYGAILDEVASLIHVYYPLSTKKHKDSYKNFIDLSLRILRTEGVYCFITPNTFVRQPRYEDIRTLLSKTMPTVLFNLGENIFEESIVPVIISIGLKKTSTEFSTLCADISQVKDSRWKTTDIADIPFSAISGDKLFGNCKYGIDLTPSMPQSGLLREVKVLFDIKDAGINYQRVNVGMKVKGNSDLSERLLYEGNQESKKDMMFWKGKDINRFYLKPKTSRWCRPNFKDFILPNEVVRLNNKVFSTVPKILVRQTADRIIACLDDKGVWFGRSIIAMLPKKGLIENEILFLLAALNSNVVSDAYRRDSGEAGRVFAQVKKSKIERILLPDPKEVEPKLLNGIAKLVKEIMNLLIDVEGDFENKKVIELNKLLEDNVALTFSCRP